LNAYGVYGERLAAAISADGIVALLAIIVTFRLNNMAVLSNIKENNKLYIINSRVSCRRFLICAI